MRFLTAIFILAAAMPSYAQAAGNYVLTPTLRVIDLDSSGKPGFVREFDGRQKGGYEVDLSLVGGDANTYLDIVMNGLNGPTQGGYFDHLRDLVKPFNRWSAFGENGYFDLNLGSSLSLRGKYMNLTHRVDYMETGMLINGVYTAKALTNLNGAAAKDLFFNRTESEGKVIYTLPGGSDGKISAGFWNETETGQSAIRYNSGNLNVGYVDRQTNEINVGATAPVGEGAVSADYTVRKFEDSAVQYITPYSSVLSVKLYARTPHQKTSLYDVRYRTGADAAVPVTAALSARTRTNAQNQFTANIYSAAFGASYRPLKKLSLTAKANGRVETTYENSSWVNLKAGNYPWVKAVDHHDLSADLKARYQYSDKLSFNAGYNFESNYRPGSNTTSFDEEINYTDSLGVLYSSYTLKNLTARQDTRHTGKLGFDASLPFDLELGASYSKMMAERAVFNGTSDDSDRAESTLIVPLPAKFTLALTAGYLAEKNKRDKTIKMNRHQNSYQTSIEWLGSSKFSTGADYAYEQNSDHSDIYNGYLSTGNIHLRGALYRYENNVIGYHATWELAKGFSLMGNGSYTISRGGVVTNLNETSTTAATKRVIYAPVDVRLASGSLCLRYLPAKYKDVTAKLGFRRNMWQDKTVAANSGTVNVTDLSVSAKF